MATCMSNEDYSIAMTVLSISTMVMGFVLGFSLCYLEKELVVEEIHGLLDKAIEKKFERDDYVTQLENHIAELQSSSKDETERPVLKRKRTTLEESSSEDDRIPSLKIRLPSPLNPIQRQETLGLPDDYDVNRRVSLDDKND